MKTVETQTAVSFRNILYLTDFSPTAEHAAASALELARRYGAKVFALHVRPLQIYTMAPAEAWPALQEAADLIAEDQIQYLDKVFESVEHQVTVDEGDIWSYVSQAIKEYGIDLIVMGTSGRGGLDKIVLGSVAEDILRRVACPVLTVGPKVSVKNSAAAGVQKILYCASLSRAANLAAAYAISLARQNRAHLDVLHIIEAEKKSTSADESYSMKGCAGLMRSLVPPESGLVPEPHMIVEHGAPAARILETARLRGANLIVMGARSSEGDFGAAIHLPGSVVHQVISRAECPVLTVRE